MVIAIQFHRNLLVTLDCSLVSGMIKLNSRKILKVILTYDAVTFIYKKKKWEFGGKHLENK